MKVKFSNMPNGSNRISFILRYLFNIFRTYWYFHVKYPWIHYSGFVRVMKGTSFGHFPLSLGNNVQFGDYCNVSTPAIIGNNVLMAGRVCLVGKHDHTFNIPGQYIWDGKRGDNGTTIIEDDVWIGHRVTIVGPVTVGRGSIIAAGAVVVDDIPPCEIWGGVPAKKIANRFQSESDKVKHLDFLKKNF